MTTTKIRNHFQRRGFSLVELLVVISILLILIALAIPAVGRTLEGSRKVKCVSNLRQLGQGTLAYAADNDQSLPPLFVNNGGVWVTFWYQEIRPYVSDLGTGFIPSSDKVRKNAPVLFCPSVKPGKGYPFTDYGANNFVFEDAFPVTNGLTIRTKTTKIEQPSKIAMFTESHPLGLPDGSDWQFVAPTVILSPDPWFAHRHGEMVNAVFCDGHVESIPRNEAVTNFTNYFGSERIWD